MLKIGEFSSLSQTSVKTLRFYDAIGLLRPAHVDGDSRYRYYSADQIAELGLILRLRAFGFALEEIRKAMQAQTDASRLRAMLLDKRQVLLERLRDQEGRLAGLDSWVQQLDRGRVTQPYSVILKRIEARTIAAIRQSIPRYSDAVDLFGELRHQVKARRAAGAPPTAIWHTCGDSGNPVDCEAFTVVRRPLSSSCRIQVYELPATLVATIVHRGSIDVAPGPYVAARQWIAWHGYRVTGPKREMYWRGGVDQSRRSDVTEIQFPVAVQRSREFRRRSAASSDLAHQEKAR
jgi:DNA-binding transcriptional MerR regulator